MLIVFTKTRSYIRYRSIRSYMSSYRLLIYIQPSVTRVNNFN